MTESVEVNGESKLRDLLQQAVEGVTPELAGEIQGMLTGTTVIRNRELTRAAARLVVISSAPSAAREPAMAPGV